MESSEHSRVSELDSLRGIAALSVALVHSNHLFSVGGPLEQRFQTSLDVFSGSQSAVILFFVLSGFVLTKSLDRSPELLPYLLRRLVRLMLPVVVVVVITYIWLLWLGALPPFLAEFQQSLSPEGLRALALNLVLADFHVDPVTWTIRAEVVGSLLIPLLIALRKKAALLAATVALMIVGSIFRNDGTFGYIYCFAFGVVAARAALPLIDSPMSLVVGLATVVFSPLLLNEGLPGSIAHLIMGLGCMLIVGWTARERPAALRSRPMLVLGRISYSFYLIHPACMVATAVLAVDLGFAGFAGNMLVLATSVALAVCAGWILYLAVERPSIQLGKAMASRLKTPRAQESAA